ncbi:MAG: fatty acid desaturase family protein [Chthoniobacterales bacterium]
MTTPPDIIEEPHCVSRSAYHVVSVLFVTSEIALAAFLYQRFSIWLVLALVALISHLMHGSLVGFHEASHGLLQRNRRFNEANGVFLGIISFMSFSLYRAAHQTHHANLGTERDEELWPFVHPHMARWKRVLAAFVELTVGLLFTPFLFQRSFLRSGSPIRQKKVRRRIWNEIIATVVIWIVALAAVAYFDGWRYFLWMYLVPAIMAANLQSWRKYIEHVGLDGNTVNSSTRSIVAHGWGGRLVSFSLLHEPYHGVHHKRAGLTHAELPQYAADLRPVAAEEKPPFRSYTHALSDLLRNLPDPRVGAQWRNAKPSNEWSAADAVRS